MKEVNEDSRLGAPAEKPLHGAVEMSEEGKQGINPNSPQQLSLVSAPCTIDKELFDLFAQFKLESKSAAIAEALGVEVPDDFRDVEAKQILEISKNIGLKPVQETRLLKLRQFVIEGHNPAFHLGEDALTPRLSQSDPLVSSQQKQVEIFLTAIIIFFRL